MYSDPEESGDFSRTVNEIPSATYRATPPPLLPLRSRLKREKPFREKSESESPEFAQVSVTATTFALEPSKIARNSSTFDPAQILWAFSVQRFSFPSTKPEFMTHLDKKVLPRERSLTGIGIPLLGMLEKKSTKSTKD
jgi:hypothetical protein